MGKYIIGESWGECLALFGIVVMAKYDNSFSFHPIRFIQLQIAKYIIGQSSGECLALFGIVVMAKYSISFIFHSLCMI
jgi:hypothetical protein